ncbi:hypothetical protein [Enemella evansiae]|uniref:hypothetical protein n=1 Tax=Enemella evansiae TaxID=2016499 RepID=UPI00117CF7F4|nr:hypothetical protein [Enemella evansiae]
MSWPRDRDDFTATNPVRWTRPASAACEICGSIAESTDLGTDWESSRRFRRAEQDESVRPLLRREPVLGGFISTRSLRELLDERDGAS